jgi:hypothetical protein
MGLEISTYINGLTPSWPVSGDPKSQGDDHIRLLKTVLQNSFPTVSGPVYFAKSTATSSLITLTISDQNNNIMVTTTGGDVPITLPSGFTSSNAGWYCEITKVTADTNAAVVSPASGTISSQVGNTATIRVGALNQPVRFVWTGSTWIAVKPGIPIGATMNFDGPIPYGFLTLDGSTYSSTTFAELFAALATTTLKDKRGRVEAGVDGGGLRLTTGYFGGAATLGAAGGADGSVIAQNQLPNVAPAFTGSSGAVSVNPNGNANHYVPYYPGASWTSFNPNIGGGGVYYSPAITSATPSQTRDFSGNFTPAGTVASINGNVTQQGRATIQPTIVSNKAIRAC